MSSDAPVTDLADALNALEAEGYSLALQRERVIVFHRNRAWAVIRPKYDGVWKWVVRWNSQ